MRRLCLALVLSLSILITACSGDIAPGRGKAPDRAKPPANTASVQSIVLSETYEAVGTVRPRAETRIEAQVTGTIRSMHASAGDLVERGMVLAVLDDREYRARKQQAAQALTSAMAARQQAAQAINESHAAFSRARSQYERSKQLFDEKAISSRELEVAEADYLQTEARLEQMRDGLRAADAGVKSAEKRLEEADIALGYTIIKAPEEAEVARRMAEPGDLAAPGKALFILQSAGNTARSLRLEAHVREGLIDSVHVGCNMQVAISAHHETLTGIVEEVVPTADPTTRTFVVKVSLPPTTGIYPGMFGRLLVPAGTREAILVPRAAVRHVGQLETVTVNDNGTWRDIFVKTGMVRGDSIEILSGLKGGDTVGLPGGADAS